MSTFVGGWNFMKIWDDWIIISLLVMDKHFSAQPNAVTDVPQWECNLFKVF